MTVEKNELDGCLGPGHLPYVLKIKLKKRKIKQMLQSNNGCIHYEQINTKKGIHTCFVILSCNRNHQLSKMSEKIDTYLQHS